MARKRELSSETRESILVLSKEGYSMRAIAKKLKISYNGVYYCLQRTAQTGSSQSRKRSGRPRCTTKQEDKHIRVSSLRNGRLTGTQLASSFNSTRKTPVSTSTVKRRLRDFGLQGRVAKKKPYLRLPHSLELPVPVPPPRERPADEGSNHEESPEDLKDPDYSAPSEANGERDPYYPNQNDINDLIKSLHLKKAKAELLMSKLQQWDLLHKTGDSGWIPTNGGRQSMPLHKCKHEYITAYPIPKNANISLQEIVHRNDGAEGAVCSERDGWCLPQTSDSLRDAMSLMIKQVIRATRPALFTSVASSATETEGKGPLAFESGEEEEEEEEFKPSDGSENEMETEILDYV